VLYLDRPAGAGFSFSNEPFNQSWANDEQTAADSVEFLKKLLISHPWLCNRQIYIAGESYAGHFAIQMAAAIADMEDGGLESSPLCAQLGGVLIGNAVVDINQTNYAWFEAGYTHSLVSTNTWESMRQECDFTKDLGIDGNGCPQGVSDACASLVQQWMVEAGVSSGASSGVSSGETPAGYSNGYAAAAAGVTPATGAKDTEVALLSLYDFYADVCLDPTISSSPSAAAAPRLKGGSPMSTILRSQRRRLRVRASPPKGLSAELATGEGRIGVAVSNPGEGIDRWAHRGGAFHGDVSLHGSRSDPEIDPCVDSHTAAYLNQATLRVSLHVSPKVSRWEPCSTALNNAYSCADTLVSVAPLYQRLLRPPTQSPIKRPATSRRLLVYSGDVDGVVPTLATRRWLAGCQNLSLQAHWRPWVAVDGQLAGYTEVYVYNNTGPGASAGNAVQGQAVFATVRGAGHMVPMFQPARAYELFRRFLSDESL